VTVVKFWLESVYTDELAVKEGTLIKPCSPILSPVLQELAPDL
jgi:hypothetical protein